jgi:hypothetical protein
MIMFAFVQIIQQSLDYPYKRAVKRWDYRKYRIMRKFIGKTATENF